MTYLKWTMIGRMLGIWGYALFGIAILWLTGTAAF
jgi:hypothetical protein